MKPTYSFNFLKFLLVFRNFEYVINHQTNSYHNLDMIKIKQKGWESPTTPENGTEQYSKSMQEKEIRSKFLTRKRFSEKPIVAFTNSTIFILDY